MSDDDDKPYTFAHVLREDRRLNWRLVRVILGWALVGALFYAALWELAWG